MDNEHDSKGNAGVPGYQQDTGLLYRPTDNSSVVPPGDSGCSELPTVSDGSRNEDECQSPDCKTSPVFCKNEFPFVHHAHEMRPHPLAQMFLGEVDRWWVIKQGLDLWNISVSNPYSKYNPNREEFHKKTQPQKGQSKMPQDLKEEDIWGFYGPGKLYDPPFCDKDQRQEDTWEGGRSICPTITHMKPQEDGGNPSPAPPPASIPPPQRGATGTSGPRAAPPAPPACNTSQPQDTTMLGSLPLSSSGSHQFPPPHPLDQMMGGEGQHPLPNGDGHLA